MKVYVFGNEDSSLDNKPFKIIEKLKMDFDVDFVIVGINSDLPFYNKENVVILDTIDGIKEVTQLDDSDLDKLITKNSTSVHDFDLGFQLKYLKKLGKLGKVIIIGIPMSGKLNNQSYLRIQRILRKLVAQDIHGS